MRFMVSVGRLLFLPGPMAASTPNQEANQGELFNSALAPLKAPPVLKQIMILGTKSTCSSFWSSCRLAFWSQPLLSAALSGRQSLAASSNGCLLPAPPWIMSFSFLCLDLDDVPVAPQFPILALPLSQGPHSTKPITQHNSSPYFIQPKTTTPLQLSPTPLTQCNQTILASDEGFDERKEQVDVRFDRFWQPSFGLGLSGHKRVSRQSSPTCTMDGVEVEVGEITVAGN